MLGRRAAMMAIAMMGAFSGAAQAQEIAPTYSPQRYAMRSATGVMLYAAGRQSGKTAAQQKRASRKAKNVKRHRAASKG